jgi:hypothetical protein
MKRIALAAALAATVARAESPLERALPDLEVHASVYANDIQPVNLEIMGGTKLVHLFLNVGAGRASAFTAGSGLGLHLGDRLWVEADASCSIFQALTGLQETDLIIGLRGSVGVQLHPRVSVFMGPALYTEVSFAPNQMLRASALAPLLVLAPPQGGGGWQFWAGLQAGIRI